MMEIEVIDFGIENPIWVYVVYKDEIWVSLYNFELEGNGMKIFCSYSSSLVEKDKFYNKDFYLELIKGKSFEKTGSVFQIYDKNTKDKWYHDYHTYDEIMNEFKRIRRNRKLEELGL